MCPMDKTLPEGYLLTKLIRPQVRSRRVARPRLLKRLNEATRLPLTLICAPAGYGKTTILVEWLATCPLPSAWLTLNTEDNDIAHFLHYLILALQQLDTSLGKSAQAVLSMPDREILSTSLRLLVNDIAGMKQEAILVLDDYHWIDSPTIHEASAYLIENIPPNLHIVIASRSEPPLNLARLRAHATLLELRLTDLGFQPQESETFIKDVMGLKLSTDDCQNLFQKTEGWPAGLQLALLSIQRGTPLPERNVHSLKQEIHTSQSKQTKSPVAAGQHDIFEFLAEEVLQRQAPDVQRFLLHTSILDNLTGPLCDALTKPFSPARNGTACLDALEHANLFTQAVDSEHRWYRYHALFADFLRNRLQNSNPEIIPQLHRKAVHWLAKYGDFNTAYNHALAAKDLALNADLTEQCVEILERHGEIATLSRWLDALPESLIAERPRLSLARAWVALVDLDFKQAQYYTDQAESAFRIQKLEKHKILEGEILAARAMTASLSGDIEQSQAYAEEALLRLPKGQDFLIVLLKFNLSIQIFLSGKVRQGIHSLEKAAQAAKESHTPFIALLALRLAGEGFIELGRLTQAEQSFQRAITLVEDEWGNESPLMGVALMGLGEIYRQRNQLEKAEQYLKQGIDMCGLWMSSLAIDGYLWLSQLQQSKGLTAEAQASVQYIRQASEKRGFSLLNEWFVQFATLHLNIIQGYLDEAAHWVHEAGLDQDPIGKLNEYHANAPPYIQQRIGHVLARLSLELGRRENIPEALLQAQQLLTHFLPFSETDGIYGVLLEGLLLLAQVESALGNKKQAQEAIHRALDLGTPERPIRVFLDEGEAIKNLLIERRDFDLHPSERTYLEELLAAWENETRVSGETIIPPETENERQSLTTDKLLKPLTFRETEVLSLIAAGHSNQEIATQLVLSLNTVKRHVSSIMQKLGAKNRTEAVMLARQWGVLPQGFATEQN